MYLTHYHLNAKPFEISADPKFLWLGQKHLKALATLKYGIASNKGLLCLTGDVGTGKTIIVNALLNRLDQSVISAIVPDPTLENNDFFEFFAGALGINKPFASKGAFLWALSEYLQQMDQEQKKVLLIIDEAQRLTDELLDEIRLLINIEENETRLLKIFFIGQNDLDELLAKPCNKSLQQRIALSYRIEPFNEDETAKYIQHRISVAGGTMDIFTAGALKKVFQYSHGYPRLINIICDLALLNGYEQERPRITTAVVNACGEELQLSREGGEQQQKAVQSEKPVGLERKPVTVASTRRAQPIHAQEEKALNSRLQYVLTLCLALLLCGSVGLTHLYRKERVKAARNIMQEQQLPPRSQSPVTVVPKPAKAPAPEAATVPLKATSSEQSKIPQPAQKIMTQEPLSAVESKGKSTSLPAGAIKPLVEVSELKQSSEAAAKVTTSAARAPAKIHPSPAEPTVSIVDPPAPKATPAGQSERAAPAKTAIAPAGPLLDRSKTAVSSPAGTFAPTKATESQPSQDRRLKTEAPAAQTLEKTPPAPPQEPVIEEDLRAQPPESHPKLMPLSSELEENIYQLDQADRKRPHRDPAQDNRSATEQTTPEPTDVIDWLLRKRAR